MYAIRCELSQQDKDGVYLDEHTTHVVSKTPVTEHDLVNAADVSLKEYLAETRLVDDFIVHLSMSIVKSDTYLPLTPKDGK